MSFPRVLFVCLYLLTAIAPASAEPVTVEGVAPIMAGDLAQARENAIRDALAEAARLSGVRVDSTTSTDRFLVMVDQTTIRTSARIGQTKVLSESHDEQTYRISLRAEVLPIKDDTRSAACRGGYPKRLLVGGFPLLYPEHVRTGETRGYAQFTTNELARFFGAETPVLLAVDSELMIHYSEAETAVGAQPESAAGLIKLQDAARQGRAQYVLLGRFRSLEAGKGGRRMELEAMIADGASGAVVARSLFRKQAEDADLPERIALGSAQFYESGLGKAYAELLTQVAQWAAASASCLPYFARITRMDDKTLHLDAGSDQGLSVGDKLSAFPADAGLSGASLGETVVKTVSARSATAEMASRQPRQMPRKGDLLFSR